MNPDREKSFAKLKALGKIIGVDGLDLICNCLSINPRLRPTAGTLLKHKFFDDIREEMTVKYIGKACCINNGCENMGFYSVPELLECHLVSYYTLIKKTEAELKPLPNYLAK